MDSWDELATFLASLPDEDRVCASSHAALGLPVDAGGIAAPPFFRPTPPRTRRWSPLDR